MTESKNDKAPIPATDSSTTDNSAIKNANPIDNTKATAAQPEPKKPEDKSASTKAQPPEAKPSAPQASSESVAKSKPAPKAEHTPVQPGTAAAQPKPTIEPKPSASDKPSPAKKGGVATLVLAVLVVLLIAGLGAGAWWVYPQWQQQQQHVQSLATELAQAQSRTESLQAELAQLASANQRKQSQSQSQYQTLEQQVRATTERLDVHNQRLLSLSNTSREDWQLAEAHYLLRLASQRLLVDRQASSAVGLMETTDAILSELALPDLFPVRQALADDLAAVRLAARVDREGIYLRLAGLINNMEKLPLYKIPEVTVTTLAEESSEPETNPWWQSLLSAAGERISGYFSLRNHDEFAAPLLPPSAGEYLRQNIRLSLEQAQIAMLREQTEIYQASLTQAIDVVARYFPDSPAKAALVEEINQLKAKTIHVTLPQIDGSLSQLQAYIERLHRLKSRVEGAEAAE